MLIRFSIAFTCKNSLQRVNLLCCQYQWWYEVKAILKATFKSCRKPISWNLLHVPWNDWLHYSSRKSILSAVQPFSVIIIDRNKYYLGPLVEMGLYRLQEYWRIMSKISRYSDASPLKSIRNLNICMIIR